jgi:hypothetical protein
LPKYVELSPALGPINGTDLDEAALCEQVYQQSNTYYVLLAIGKIYFLGTQDFQINSHGSKLKAPCIRMQLHDCDRVPDIKKITRKPLARRCRAYLESTSGMPTIMF